MSTANDLRAGLVAVAQHAHATREANPDATITELKAAGLSTDRPGWQWGGEGR